MCESILPLEIKPSKLFNTILLCFFLLIISLFHMESTASVTKSLHQDLGPCYLQLLIFFFYIHSFLLWQNKTFLQLFSSLANWTTYHYSVIYITRLFRYIQISISTTNIYIYTHTHTHTHTHTNRQIDR